MQLFKYMLESNPTCQMFINALDINYLYGLNAI